MASGKRRIDPLSAQVDRITAAETGTPASVEARVDGAYANAPSVADTHLTNFHQHFAQNYAEEKDDDLYFRVTRAIVVAARRWRKLANERVKAVGQTMARWETLFLVAFSGEELTQSDLARLISIEGPTLVRMLDLLAKEGLIDRSQSETDRRVTTNRITPRGEEVVAEVMGVTNMLRADVLRDIPKEDLEHALRVLSRVIQRINEIR